MLVETYSIAYSHTVSRILAMLVVGFLSINGRGQVVLNEVCSKNNSVLADPIGDHPDWVEIRNAGEASVDLGDHFLSNSIGEPDRWRLPNLTLQPGGFIILFSGDPASGEEYFPFKISQDGESLFLSNADLELMDVVHVPYLHADHSYGRIDGIWRFFAAPTPGQQNDAPSWSGYAPRPVVDHAPGYHGSAFDLALSVPLGFMMHLTWNGSDPGLSSPTYTTPLRIENTTVVKAIATGPDHLPSDPFIGTYAIGTTEDLPTVSISTHPDSLWDWEHGIYVLGPEADSIFPFWGANYWRGNHIPAHVEYFDAHGHLSLSQRVDLRIQGGSQARTKPQRPLRLTARKEYGNEVMAYTFFDERGSLDRFKHLVLRNSSGDFCLSNFRDGLWHQVALHNDLDIDVLGFDPVRLYLNGEYWGLMNLRERISPHHLAYNYGADKDLLLLMDKENVSVQGDTIHFHMLREFMQDHDLNDPAHWAYVASLLDIPSLKDYFALEIYAGNADWPANNVRYWKPSVEEGKWRYILHDLDATMNVFGWIAMDIDMFWEILVHRAGWTHSEVFRDLLENEEFERTFVNRLADLMNTAFREERLISEVERIRAGIEQEIPDHFMKWECNLDDWYHHVTEVIPEFARVRPAHVRDHVLATFGLPYSVDMGFAVFPEGTGMVRINTIQPELPFKGHYFHGNAIDVTVEPEGSWEFDHWEYRRDEVSHFRDRTLQLDPDQDGQLIAFFKSPGKDLIIFPNPGHDQIQLSVYATREGTASITFTDLGGREVIRSKASVGEGVNAIRSNVSGLSVGTYLVTVVTDENIFTGPFIKAF